MRYCEQCNRKLYPNEGEICRLCDEHNEMTLRAHDEMYGREEEEMREKREQDREDELDRQRVEGEYAQADEWN
jgi:hypothetical protein